MFILCVPSVEAALSQIYTDYSIAYVGRNFSESFIGWNYDFCKDVTNAITSTSTRYIGSTCTLDLVFLHSPRYGKISIILKCVINMGLLRTIERQSNAERVLKGLRPVPPTTFTSMPSVDVGKSPRFTWKPPIKRELVLPSNAKILNGIHYNGLRVAYYNHKYTIVDAEGNPITNKWFDKKPKFFKKPFGKYGIIAHVSYYMSLFAVGIDGQMYDMQRLWTDTYLREVYEAIIKSLITEAINSYLRKNLLLAS